MPRKEKAIGAWGHSQIQIGVETKATERQHPEDSHCSTAAGHRSLAYLHVKQSCMHLFLQHRMETTLAHFLGLLLGHRWIIVSSQILQVHANV